MKVLGVKNWWRLAKDREVWRKILSEADAHGGLCGATDDGDTIDRTPRHSSPGPEKAIIKV